MEGSVCLVNCVEDLDECGRIKNCTMHKIWSSLKDLVVTELKRYNLSDLAREQSLLNLQLPGVTP